MSGTAASTIFCKRPRKHEVRELWIEMVKFAKIAFPYVLIATATAYFTRIYAFRWREAMTFSYVAKWQDVEEEVEGASQRIQEDIYRFARIFESLGLQVVRALLTLIAFLPILWGLSSGVDLPYIKDDPGQSGMGRAAGFSGWSVHLLVCGDKTSRTGI